MFSRLTGYRLFGGESSVVRNRNFWEGDLMEPKGRSTSEGGIKAAARMYGGSRV